MGRARWSQYPADVDGRKRMSKPDYVRNLARREAHEARTRDWKVNFLRAYAESGNITRSCKAASIDPRIFYKARREDPDFAEAFEVAHRAATDKVLEAVWQIGVEGNREPILWQGEIVAYVRRRDWKAAKFLLETFDPGTYSSRERIARMGMMQADQIAARRDQMLAEHGERMKAFTGESNAIPAVTDAEEVSDDADDGDADDGDED